MRPTPTGIPHSPSRRDTDSSQGLARSRLPGQGPPSHCRRAARRTLPPSSGSGRGSGSSTDADVHQRQLTPDPAAAVASWASAITLPRSSRTVRPKRRFSSGWLEPGHRLQAHLAVRALPGPAACQLGVARRLATAWLTTVVCFELARHAVQHEAILGHIGAIATLRDHEPQPAGVVRWVWPGDDGHHGRVQLPRCP